VIAPDPLTIDIANPDAAAGMLAVVSDTPAVFLLWPSDGSTPYLGRTTVLRRRLLRMLTGERKPSMSLRLSGLVKRVDYWMVGSALASSLIHYTLARRYFPETYLKLTKLRMPPYLRVILSNEFPRTQVTTRLGGSRSLYYGPFRTRASAEMFESQYLDLFQVRRCQEDLIPSPQHPGCMYGEMNMCLRPCQQAVTVEEYASEVKRASDFLASDGRSLVQVLSTARDHASDALDFEEAGKIHKRLEKVDQVGKLRDDLVSDAARAQGITVTPSAMDGCVELRPLSGGCWQAPITFPLREESGKPISLERRLRERLEGIAPETCTTGERQEHLALLARWYYSSWRDGEWLSFETLESLSWRKLSGAIHRVAAPTT
jgi:excinuclease ABC subunit C